MLSVPIVPGALGTAIKESWYVLKAALAVPAVVADIALVA
jgi:hypothetical protein